MKQKREKYVETYHPMTWIQTSGLVVLKDAEYVLCLPTMAQRQHEVWRLGVIHGRYWATQVQDKVFAMWEQRFEIRAKYPKASIDEIVSIINQSLKRAA